MAYIKTEEEIEIIKHSSLLVGKTLAEVAKLIAPGVTLKKLDLVAEEYILSHGAKPGFKGYHGYPATLCVSVNEQVVHGIPNERVLIEGDIVSVDCGVLWNGYYGDYAYTFCVGDVKPGVKRLLDVTKESLLKGVAMAIAGNRTGDIGNAIQKHVEAYGFSVVRDLVGHGIGRNLHEEPQVPNFGKPKSGTKLQEGMVICIEPMINMGDARVAQSSDGWTYYALDGLPSAHFEHQVVIRKDKAELLSSFEFVEEILNLQKNKWLNSLL